MQSADMNDEAILELRNAVVLQAVEDWRNLRQWGVEYVRPHMGGSYGIAEIRNFFKSEYGHVLLGDLAPVFLEQLEKE